MIILQNELGKIRTNNLNRTIVCCTGVFDLTHAGHILFFEDCKKHGDVVVGIGKDSLIKKYKGDTRPILNEHIRLKSVDSLKPVDYAFLIKNERWGNKDAHKKILDPIFKELKPDFYIFNDDVGEIEIRKKICENNGVVPIILKRYCPEEFENISTTRIIKKIKNL